MKIPVFHICLSVLILTGFRHVSAYACSCLPPPPPAEEYQRVDAVFSGGVVTIALDTSLSYPRLKVAIRVTQSWKGVSLIDVIIYTNLNEASCGYPFIHDSTYLVYAYYEGDSLTTNLCTRTRLLREAGEDLAFLLTLGAQAVPIVRESVLLDLFPNQSVSRSTVLLTIPRSAVVDLRVYNLKGEIMESLLVGWCERGTTHIVWDRSRYPSGVYFLTLLTNIGTSSLLSVVAR